jgi:hypothetical protein
VIISYLSNGVHSCVDILVTGVVQGAGDKGAEVDQGLRVVTPVRNHTHMLTA